MATSAAVEETAVVVMDLDTALGVREACCGRELTLETNYGSSPPVSYRST